MSLINVEDILTEQEMESTIFDELAINTEATEEELVFAIKDAALDKLVKNGWVDVIKNKGELEYQITSRGQKLKLFLDFLISQ